MKYTEQIIKHLEVCEKADGEFSLRHNEFGDVEISCSCKKYFKLFPCEGEEEAKKFFDAARMFPKVPKQNAVKLEDVIDPILGFLI